MPALRRSAPTLEIPDPALVVLVGTAGSGKSHWAAQRYRSEEIVSADQLRAVVGSGPADLDASIDAFALLDSIVAARAGRGLTVVVDTLGLDRERRYGYLALARRVGLPAVVVSLDTPAALARARNGLRDRPVPAKVLAAQLQRMRATTTELDTEGWDVVLHVGSEAADLPGASARPSSDSADAGGGSGRSTGPKVVLHVASFPWSGAPGRWLTDLAQSAEELGFHGLSLMDHLIQIPQVGRPFDPIPDPFVALGHVAAATSRLRLGTLVSPVTWRAAASLAKAAATLDVLSGGRAFLGVGAGWWAREHAAAGLPFPSATSRLDALEDALLTIRALWSAGTKPYEHGRIRLPETTAYPRPFASADRQGSIPIVVGGSGERRTLAIAARHADAVNLPTSDEAVVARKIAVLRRHLADAGRDPAEVEVTVLDNPVVGVDRADVSRRVERLRGRTPAPAFAARHHAATSDRHAERYVALQAMGVGTVFVSLPDLTGADDLPMLAGVLSTTLRASS